LKEVIFYGQRTGTAEKPAVPLGALTDAQVPEFDKDLLPKGKDVFTLAESTTQ